MTLPIRPDPAHSVAVVLPLSQLDEHGAPVIVRRRGRQRRIERGCPTVSQELYEEAIARAAEQATEVDEVVVASQGNNPVELINKVVAAVASETAALRWERARAVREGRPNAEQISSRRVAALGRLAESAPDARAPPSGGGRPRPGAARTGRPASGRYRRGRHPGGRLRGDGGPVHGVVEEEDDRRELPRRHEHDMTVLVEAFTATISAALATTVLLFR